MSNFYQLEYVKYSKGGGGINCLVDALHSEPPQADLYTGKIVEELVGKINCAGIISTVSRTVADLNRKPNGRNNEALAEYRNTITEILKHNGLFDSKLTLSKPFLHLSIHGMKDLHHGPYSIEIGTQNSLSCSKEMKNWFYTLMQVRVDECLPQTTIFFDDIFDGDESITFHRVGDGETFNGYGNHFHTFQLEFSRTLREEHSSEIVYILQTIIYDFQKKFFHSK